uniref:Lysophosphatidic acid phosphatase type 6-like n=1 Tax=Phallusia mammillata TaxID=59560 RepID=A0A6F9D5I3_9ASCI|nr:lysophosphatidic acid phosphatase type 6-like [Phallusia mammillata]
MLAIKYKQLFNQCFTYFSKSSIMGLRVISICSSASVLGYMMLRREANCVSKSDSVQQVPSEFDLKLVQIVFRHGARTPLFIPKYLPKVLYPDDILQHPQHTFVPFNTLRPDGKPYEGYKLHLTKGKFLGNLTTTGAEQMYRLGCSIRQKYVNELNFLKPEISDEVNVRSTEIPRAIESARSTLAGLFPGTKAPISIEVAPVDEDYMFPNFNKCHYLKLLSRWAWVEPDLLHEMKDKRERIELAYNISSEEKVHIVTLRDCIVAHKEHGVLPANYDIPVVNNELENAALEIMHHVFAGTKETRNLALKLGIGPLIGTVLSNISSCINRQCHKKLYLFSGHDTTLMPLMQAFGITDFEWPPFAADITIELYEKKESGEQFIRILYLGKARKVSGCTDTLCPLEQFKKSMSKFIMDKNEYAKQCAVKNDKLLQSLPKVQ